MDLRAARPSDYDEIISLVDAWWGRPVAGALPRLFFDHFYATSLIASTEGEPQGFLVGIFSPSDAAQAYIHFVGVAPAARGLGLGRTLYETFFALARSDGRRRISAITAPVNTGSVAFHREMGFAVAGPVRDYDGPGRDMMHFHRDL